MRNFFKPSFFLGMFPVMLGLVMLAAGCAKPVDPMVQDQGLILEYANTDQGYSLTYDASRVSLSVDVNEDLVESPNFSFTEGGNVQVQVYPNSEKLTPREWLDKQYQEYAGAWYGEYADTSINGREAVLATVSNECFIEYVIIPKDESLYTIRTEICSDNLNEASNAETEKAASIKVYQDILNSFIIN
jgi:hypothetical protein